MPGFGTFAYGAAPYGGGGGTPSAADSWTVADVATRHLELARTGTDAWLVSDDASGIWGFDPNGFDSFTVSDLADATRSMSRRGADSWTVHDAALGLHVPYVDLPSHLAIKGDAVQMVLRAEPAGSALEGKPHALALQPGDSCTLQDGGSLALKDEPTGEWVDG